MQPSTNSLMMVLDSRLFFVCIVGTFEQTDILIHGLAAHKGGWIRLCIVASRPMEIRPSAWMFPLPERKDTVFYITLIRWGLESNQRRLRKRFSNSVII
jgi:hypothetical protein